MTYKSIFLFLDNTSASESSQAMAFSLARRFSAQVTGLALAIEPIVPALGMHPVLLDAIEIQRQASIEEAERLQSSFEDTALRADINFESRVEICTYSDGARTIANNALCSDLIIMCAGTPGQDQLGTPDLVEKVMPLAAHPVLVVPPRGGMSDIHESESAQTMLGRRVILAWNASREAARAASDAMPFLTEAEAVKIIYVNLESPAQEAAPGPGTDVARYLSRHDCLVEADVLTAQSSDIGETLMTGITDFGADLLVMGAYGHSRLRELALGGVTQTIFKSLKTPVLMAH